MDVGGNEPDNGGGKPSPKKKAAPTGGPGLCVAALSMATVAVAAASHAGAV